MQFHIVQRHSSASTAVLKKKKKKKKKTENESGGGGGRVLFWGCFFSLLAVMWPSPPQPSTQNRACN